MLSNCTCPLDLNGKKDSKDTNDSKDKNDVLVVLVVPGVLRVLGVLRRPTPRSIIHLIDNSITAGAQRIHIVIEDSKPTPYIAVMDDGCGMDLKTLIEAMRMGTRGPEVTRAPTDLGRFGLGMKTASLSQGRAFTVITRQKGRKPLIRRWDIEHIRKRQKWQLLATPTTTAERFLKQLSSIAHHLRQLHRYYPRCRDEQLFHDKQS